MLLFFADRYVHRHVPWETQNLLRSSALSWLSWLESMATMTLFTASDMEISSSRAEPSASLMNYISRNKCNGKNNNYNHTWIDILKKDIYMILLQTHLLDLF